MRKKSKALRFLLEKEFKQTFRNPVMVPLIILLPTLQLLILPFAATYEIKNIHLTVVDHDRSTYSQQLVDKVTSSGYFKIKSEPHSYHQALEEIEMERADMILEIPKDFETKIREGKQAQLLIAANAVDGTKANIGSAYLNTIILDFSAEKYKLASLQDEQKMQRAQEGIPQIEIIPHYKYNPHLDYKTYMVPGLIVLMLTLMGGVLAAMNIIMEKELGTLEQINVSPVKKIHYLLAKLIPFWIIGFLILFISLIMAWSVYHIQIQGSLLTIILFSAVYLIAFSGFGLLISLSAKTLQQSMFIAFFFLLIFFLMGGLFTPISSMPTWAQYIAFLNPIGYFVDAVRLIILKGSHFTDLLPQFFALCGFAVGFNTWAFFSYKKTD